VTLCTLLLGRVATCGVKHPQVVTHAIAPLILLAIAFLALAVSYVIMSMLMKTQKAKPAGLDEWDFPQVDEGTPKAIIFGDRWTEAAFVCWYGNYRTSKIQAAAAGGKK
jgi:hypothetical protein